MAQLTPEMIANKWKPGDIPNPGGNTGGWSTRPWKKVFQEMLDSEEFEIEDLKGKARTAKAKDALVYVMAREAAKGNVRAAQLVLEWSEGKLEQPIKLTDTGTDDRYKEMMDKIKDKPIV